MILLIQSGHFKRSDIYGMWNFRILKNSVFKKKQGHINISVAQRTPVKHSYNVERILITIVIAFLENARKCNLLRSDSKRFITILYSFNFYTFVSTSCLSIFVFFYYSTFSRYMSYQIYKYEIEFFL